MTKTTKIEVGKVTQGVYDALANARNRLRLVTKDAGVEMHESSINLQIKGRKLDNAHGDHWESTEATIRLTNEDGVVEVLNLADLLALARLAKLPSVRPLYQHPEALVKAAQALRAKDFDTHLNKYSASPLIVSKGRHQVAYVFGPDSDGMVEVSPAAQEKVYPYKLVHRRSTLDSNNPRFVKALVKRVENVS